MYINFHFFASHPASARTAMVRELAAKCVDVVAAAEAAFTIVVFDNIDDDLCSELREITANSERVLAIDLGSCTSTSDIWKLLQAGVQDVIQWRDAGVAATTVAEKLGRWSEVDALISSNAVRDFLIGDSPTWKNCLRRVVEMAHFTDSAVLILGESGTGKELVARLIHELDARKHKSDFVLLDCTTIVPELSGSEFFGHERGAFTNALQAREGAIELAERGTLFIDEVGELAPALQSQLLRVVQEHSYKRIGGNVWRSVDFRLICATNRELSTEVDEGHFRQDLYYRVAASVIRLPPLSERRDDIPLLARHFMQEIDPRDPPVELDKAVRDYLLLRDYPGNIRELRQLSTRIFYRHIGPGPVTIGDIPEEDRPVDQLSTHWRNASFQHCIRKAVLTGAKLKDIGRAAEDEAIQIAINDADGNLRRAAEQLGVTDRTLQLRRAGRQPSD